MGAEWDLATGASFLGSGLFSSVGKDDLWNKFWMELTIFGGRAVKIRGHRGPKSKRSDLINVR